MPMNIADLRRENLRKLLEDRFEGKKSALAHAIEREPSYISRCLSDKSHRKKIGEDFARHIERSLNLPSGWMDQDQDKSSAVVSEHPAFKESNVAPPPKMEGYVPVLSWIQAGAWTDMSNVDFISDEMVPKPPGSSDNTFGLRVRGQSMAPKYEPGLIIYVDPEVPAYDGDDVVAILTEDNEATFKQLVEEPGGRRLLKARNPSWPDPWVPINGNCEIIGVVIGFLWMRAPRTS